MPAESSRAATERVMREIDARILALHDPDVAELQSTTGYSRTDTWTVTGDHVGMSSLRLVDPEVRSSATAGQGVLAEQHRFGTAGAGPLSPTQSWRRLGEPVLRSPARG